jgi:hypothetical protein
MAGIELNRIIGLNESQKQYLKCGVCLCIFNRPVDNICGHTFCNDCINGWLNQYNDSCPECRSYLGMGYNSKPFKDSYTLKRFINKLIIKCDFVDKGCEVVFELELLLKHLEECNY